MLHKEGSGGDNLAVAWKDSGLNWQLIVGQYLSPFVPGLGSTMATAKEREEKLEVFGGNEVRVYPIPAAGGKFTVLLGPRKDTYSFAVV